MGHRHRRPQHHDPHFRGRHGQWERAWFGGPPWAGGRRARRGEVRTALLTLLADKPMHGYDLIRDLEERSGGAWRPSPGSIYPTLQLLEDEGLVTSEEQDGKRVYTITDDGRAELDERRQRGGEEPWRFGPLGEGFGQLRDSGVQLAEAATQVARTGSEAQRKRAAEILAEARKKLYALLAED
ncbi:MAG: PadR family transcriptional regulator [Actinobacteria bacterium]|nr:PadR family transcriptional regulator [Actinomycetota bacterium]